MNFAQRTSSLLGLTALAALGGLVSPAHADAITRFDYPGSSSTRGFSINYTENVVGLFTDSSGATKGYERLANGTFGAIVDPGDNGGFTRAWGINNAGTIVGDYLNINAGVYTYHGFVLKNGVYTTFDIGGPYSTDIFAVNNAGDFAGIYGSSAYANRAFLSVGGVVTTFGGPTGSTNIVAQGINNSDQVVGDYTDSNGVTHGFSRNATSGEFKTIDVPGAIYTIANGINDAGTIVGGYEDSSYVFHGFFDKGGIITTFNLLGASSTSIVSINNAGVIAGNYTDNYGNFHGFIDILPTPTYILWNNPNGQASLWTVVADGSFTVSPTFGPYPGWTAKAISVGPDGLTHLLWTNTNGTVVVWNVMGDGSFTQHAFGPYAGWKAVSLSTNPGGASHLLWNKTDGTASLWTLNTSTGTFTQVSYGPYSGWTANQVADGTSVTDLLWNNVNGAAYGWRLNSNGLVNKSFGPYRGWNAQSLSVGSDDGAHLLWDNTSGQVALWNVDFGSSAFTQTAYGPFSGWTAKATATGRDNVTRILWNHASDGQASLWNISSSGVTNHEYGPFPGYSAAAVAAP